MDIQTRNGLQEIIDKALEEMNEDYGGELDFRTLNLAEFCRRTGLSRSKARTLKEKGFKVTPHGRTGQRSAKTVLTGYTGTIDKLLGNINLQMPIILGGSLCLLLGLVLVRIMPETNFSPAIEEIGRASCRERV